MSSDGKFVGVMVAGALTVHMASTNANHATLCGMDGDDPHSAVDQRPTSVPRGKKINCKNCLAIWQVAKQYRASDFE
jgi:hypothetical protein